jgi:hypothetical protein
MRRVLLLAMLLGGCASSQNIATEVAPRYQDKDANLLFMRWGAPTKTLEVDGGNIYFWQDAPPARECRVEAHANEDNKILGVRFVGSEPHCAVWMKMLR